jgi:transposase
LGLPVFFLLSEGQESDMAYAEELLSHVNIEDSDVLADKGYDSDALIDYIYDHGAEPTIPSKSNRKVQRRCDWWLYKERHLVEYFFLKLKNFRRVATRYDKLDITFAAFVCVASIVLWLK